MSLRVLQRHYVSLFVAFLSRLSLRVFNCSAWRCHSHASLLVVCCWVGLLAIKLSFVAKSAITFVISPGAACHIGWVLLNNPVGLNGISIGHTATKYRRFRFALSKACLLDGSICCNQAGSTTSLSGGRSNKTAGNMALFLETVSRLNTSWPK